MKETATFSSGLGIFYNQIPNSTSSNFLSSPLYRQASALQMSLFKALRLSKPRVCRSNYQRRVLLHSPVCGRKCCYNPTHLATFLSAVSTPEYRWLFNTNLPISWLSILGGPGGPQRTRPWVSCRSGRDFMMQTVVRMNDMDSLRRKEL